jgi:hypothetical protein
MWKGKNQGPSQKDSLATANKEGRELGRQREREERRCHMGSLHEWQAIDKERPNKHLDLLFPKIVALVCRDTANTRAARIVYGVDWILTAIVDRKSISVGGFSTATDSIVRGSPVILHLVAAAGRAAHLLVCDGEEKRKEASANK